MRPLLINTVCVYLLLIEMSLENQLLGELWPEGCVGQFFKGPIMTDPKFCMWLYCSNSMVKVSSAGCAVFILKVPF